MAERIDWVEIQEPHSGNLMYANIRTGECLWEAPISVKVKKSSTNQWWELYDEKTRRYYYYNAHTKQTEWRKPKDCDIITLAKLQNLKGRASKRRSSSSRKDSSSRRRGSTSNKEGGKLQSQRDDERSLPRKYTRHNSGESLSYARKTSSISNTENQGHSSKLNETIGNDKESTSGDYTLDNVETKDSSIDDESNYFKGLRRRSSEREENVVMHTPRMNVKSHTSNSNMGLDDTSCSSDMDNTTRHIKYLNISGEITEECDDLSYELQQPDDADCNTEEDESFTSFNALVPPPLSPSIKGNIMMNSTTIHQSNYVSDGPVSESETAALNDSLNDTRNVESNINVEPSTIPPEESSPWIHSEDIPRTTSFFNKMVDQQGNLKMFNQDEHSYKVQRHESCRSRNRQVSPPPVLREEGGRRRSNSLEPQAYDNVTSPFHSTYDNLRPDDFDDQGSFATRLVSGGMPHTTALLVEDCEPDEMMSTPVMPNRGSGVYQHQVSDTAVLHNFDSEDHHGNTLIRSNTCPVVRTNHDVPLTPPPPVLKKYVECRIPVQSRRGLFGRKDNLTGMPCHSKQALKKPVLNIRDKQLKKEAIEMFKLVLVYMGDKSSQNKECDIALWEIVTKAWANQPLRDELYFQLIKQTTDNNSSSSLEKGWELMAVCLSMFAPSAKYHSYLDGYVSNHLKDSHQPTNRILEQEISNRIAHYAQNCQYKLEKMEKTGSRKGQRQPTLEEVRSAKRAIFHPSMFGSTLDDTMAMQQNKFPDHKLPWILTCLTEQILKQNGTSTEGIFRVPGDIDEVNALKVKTDSWCYPDDCNDPNVAASLLKQWFRELKDPLLDECVYERCISNCDDEVISCSIVSSLPNNNRFVLCFIIRFLQIFCQPDVIRVTKMDVNNLAMVWAPNFLRCPSNEPKVIYENTRKEMAFVRTLLNSFDAKFMEGVK